MFYGQLAWAIAYLAALSGIGIIFNLVAAPIGVLGWFLVWGDNGPPDWAKQHLVHVAFGLLMYGMLGAALGIVIFSYKSAR